MTREEALKTLTEKLATSGLILDGSRVNGVWIGIECCEEAHAGSWRYTKNGKLRFIVGNYGDKVQFPQTKDGGFNFDKIVEAVANRIKQHHYRAECAAKAASKREQADVECSQLRATHGLKEYSGKVRVTPCDYGIELVVSKGITKEQADAMLAAAKACGLIES
jgi:hypothetical protein